MPLALLVRPWAGTGGHTARARGMAGDHTAPTLPLPGVDAGVQHLASSCRSPRAFRRGVPAAFLAAFM